MARGRIWAIIARMVATNNQFQKSQKQIIPLACPCSIDRLVATMRIALSLAFILSPWSLKAGAEEIRIDQARFEDGMLVVRGEIIPSASESRVTLDGKFTVLTDAHGKFNFNLRHTSFLCNVTLQIASIRHSAKVDGCMMNDIRLRHSEPGR